MPMYWIVQLPRIARIVLAGVFALAVTMLISPLVDSVYLRSFYNPDTVMLPSLISAVVGVVIYVIGWRVWVGYSGERPRYTRVLLIYVVIGLFVTIFTTALTLFGIIRQ
ncbi:MAG: hypothetical protein IAE80_27435 [Anaerolinea sp.]|nr:hypothetical protein [Anaerolinea sp.]